MGVVDFKEKVLTHGILDLLRGVGRLYTVSLWCLWYWYGGFANIEMRLILFNYLLVACSNLYFGRRFIFLCRPLAAPALECELVKELTRIYLTLLTPQAHLSRLLRLRHLLACGVKSEPFELFGDFLLLLRCRHLLLFGEVVPILPLLGNLLLKAVVVLVGFHHFGDLVICGLLKRFLRFEDLDVGDMVDAEG